MKIILNVKKIAKEQRNTIKQIFAICVLKDMQTIHDAMNPITEATRGRFNVSYLRSEWHNDEYF